MKTSIVLVTATMLATFSAPSMAYIDPGSGSAIMSAIVGCFVAVSMLVKTYWYKLKSIFSSKDNLQKTESAVEDQAEKS